MLQNLWTFCHIMSSDEDQPVVEDLYVGFDEDMCLVATIEHINYDNPEYSCSVSAIVGKDDAFTLSKRIKVSMKQLPDAISEFTEEYTEIVNADFKQVQECFKTIIDWFIDKNCPYRIARKYGKDGFICC